MELEAYLHWYARAVNLGQSFAMSHPTSQYPFLGAGASHAWRTTAVEKWRDFERSSVECWDGREGWAELPGVDSSRHGEGRNDRSCRGRTTAGWSEGGVDQVGGRLKGLVEFFGSRWRRKDRPGHLEWLVAQREGRSDLNVAHLDLAPSIIPPSDSNFLSPGCILS